MKKFIIAASVLSSSLLLSQVGINNKEPKTTLDITAKRNANGSINGNDQLVGLQAPRLNRAELTANVANYSTDQSGALIYITDISGGNAAAGTQREYITAIGYYYFDAVANKWQKIANSTSGNSYTASNGIAMSSNNVKLGGSLTEPTTISGATAANKFAVTGTGVDAINFDSNTLSIDATNDRVGIGTNAPSEKLDVSGNGKLSGKLMVGTTWTGGGSLSVKNNTSTDNIASFVGSDNTFKAILSNNGNLGVGTTNPASKIHTVSSLEYGAFQMQDGSEGDGKLLSSNSQGKATWVNSPLMPIVSGTKIINEITLNENQNTGSTITLSKGRWMVYIGLLVNPVSNASSTNNVWIRLTLSSSSSSQQSNGFDFLSSNLVSGWLNNISTTSVARYTFLTGVIPVEITSNGNLTLHLRTREFNTVGTPPSIKTMNYAENFLFAIPAY